MTGFYLLSSCLVLLLVTSGGADDNPRSIPMEDDQDPVSRVFHFCKAPHEPELPPPPPTIRTTTLTTKRTTTKSLRHINGSNISSTTTTVTTTTSTPGPTTTTERQFVYEQCPQHNRTNKVLPDMWHEALETRLLDNTADIVRGVCSIYLYGLSFEHWRRHFFPTYLDFSRQRSPNFSTIHDTCDNPMSLMTDRYRRNTTMEHAKEEFTLIPIKQRRTENSHKGFQVGADLQNLKVVKIECKKYPLTFEDRQREHCYDCRKSGQKYERHIPANSGKLIPFANWGEKCNLENEAYLHGAVLMDVANQVDEKGSVDNADEEYLPWGRLYKYWPRLVNLNLMGIDQAPGDDGSGELKNECPHGSFHEKINYGDCIFNQRLAPKSKILHSKLEYYHCHTGWKESDRPNKDPRFAGIRDDKYQIIKVQEVALGCNPALFLMCNQEYDRDQMLNSTCICNPLYSTKNPDYKIPADGIINSTNYPCLPRVGVPCGFQVSGDPNNIDSPLIPEFKCAPNMTCEYFFESEKKNTWEMFELTFTGFGMSPIARDYMITKASKICRCKDWNDPYNKYIQTPFNECIPRAVGYPLKSNIVLVIVSKLLSTLF